MRIFLVLILLALAVMAARSLWSDADTRERQQATEPLLEPEAKASTEPDLLPGLEQPESSDQLARTLATILADLVHGRLGVEDSLLIEQRIVEALAVDDLADSVTMASAARSTSERLLEEMRKARAQGGAALPESQTVMVTQAMAGRLAGELRRALSRAGNGEPHDGTFLAVGFEFEAPAGYEKVSWSVIGGFDYKRGMELPAAVQRLHQQKVALAGYMMSTGEFEDIHRFALVESQWSCCFGMPPNVNQIVIITIPDLDDGIELIAQPILVYGRLDAEENIEDEWVLDVYRIEAAGVEIL